MLLAFVSPSVSSGFPSHCSEHCYQRDTAHHAIADDLRMIHQDYADLQSGRKFAEFDFPGPPPHDYVRGDLNNWVSFLSDREFKNALGKKIGWTRSEEEKFIEARSMRLISSMFTFPLTIAHAIYWKSALGDPAKVEADMPAVWKTFAAIMTPLDAFLKETKIEPPPSDSWW